MKEHARPVPARGDTVTCSGPLWLPDAQGLLRPLGDSTDRFRVEVHRPARHMFMVGSMLDVSLDGRIGKIRASQVRTIHPPTTSLSASQRAE